MKNAFDGFDNRLHTAKIWISELKHSLIDTSEMKREKKWRENQNRTPKKLGKFLKVFRYVNGIQ